jgi:hypothetical protein
VPPVAERLECAGPFNFLLDPMWPIHIHCSSICLNIGGSSGAVVGRTGSRCSSPDCSCKIHRLGIGAESFMEFPLIKSQMQMILKLTYYPSSRWVGEPAAASVLSHIGVVPQERHLLQDFIQVAQVLLCNLFMKHRSRFVDRKGLEYMSNRCT